MTFLCPFLVWLALGLIGAVIAVLSADLALMTALPDAPDVPPAIWRLILFTQPALLIALATAVGVALSARVGLSSWLTDRLQGQVRPFPNVTAPALLGFGLGAIIFLLDGFIMGQMAEQGALHWLMAFTYGGISEELMLRYGLLTLLFYSAMRLGRGPVSPRAAWMLIGVAALVFGAAHLPAMAHLGPLTPLILLRTIAFNASLGLAYGWAYWRRGLEAAMAAHMATHVAFFVMGQILA